MCFGIERGHIIGVGCVEIGGMDQLASSIWVKLSSH